jgi:signal transduction histidine kinase
MSKGLIISISILLVTLCIDFISLRPTAQSACFEQLEVYVDSELSHYKSLLSSEEYIHLYTKDTLTTSDLARIKRLEDQLSRDHIFARVYQGSKQLYWKQGSSDESFCDVRKANDSVTVNVCLEVYDESGELFDFIYERSGVKNRIYSTSNEDSEYKLFNSIPLEIGDRNRSKKLNYILICCYILGLFLLILNCVRKKNLLLFGSIIVARILLFFMAWHERFQNLDIVNSIFNTTDYNSIDLMLDTLLITGSLIFLSKIQIPNKAKRYSFLYNVINLSFLILLFIAHLRLIQLLIYSDRLNIAINNLSNIGIRDTIIFGSTLAFLAAIFIYATTIIISLKNQLSRRHIALSFFVMMLASVVLVHLFRLDINPLFFGLFMVSFLFLLDLFIDINYKTITWVIWWAILFGIYLSAVFFNYDIKKDIFLHEDFLQNALYTLDDEEVSHIKNSGVLSDITREVNELLILPEEAQYDRQDINDYLNEKFARSDFQVEVFDSLGHNLFDAYKMPANLINVRDSVSFDEIDNIVWFSRQGADRYIIETGFQLPIRPRINDFPINYYINNKKVRQDLYLSPSEISLVNNSPDNIIHKNSDVYIKYKPSADKLLITKKSFFSIVKPVALFSFLFSAIVLLILILGIANTFIDFLPDNWPFKVQNIDSLNSKIQLGLILVILFSFILIAIITTSFLKTFIENRNELFIKEKLNAIARDLDDKTKIAQSEQETVAIAKNYEKSLEITHDAELDIIPLNNKRTKGEYFPFVYFAKQVAPRAFRDYSQDKRKNFIPILYDSKTVGYTVLSYKNNLSSSVSVFDFLGSIFNVYVFLFLITSVLAIFIARSITKPLALLNQKLSQLTLGKRNELISWDKEDEIGILIKNYNNMVNQLEKSAVLLAKTERDSAWREMAKQVAHEIKNPLTPMKMYIQHLEKAISQQPENAKQITKKISATLMEQIDNLTQIANSFSNFAELPKTNNTKIELNSVVEVVHNLFRKREDMEISLSEPINSINVFADKNQLIRILNNLVKNAIESIPHDKKGKIVLKLYSKGDKAIIQVSDNGSGVPDDMKDKIFQPKFTTKDSGSGLGLAIASNMLESMNGRLYFDSEENIGTNFYIELDNIRPKTITLD